MKFFCPLYSLFSQLGERDLEEGRPALRILDAAVIDGDDISDLPYDQRMQAAQKLCDVIRLAHDPPGRRPARAFAARVSFIFIFSVIFCCNAIHFILFTIFIYSLFIHFSYSNWINSAMN